MWPMLGLKFIQLLQLSDSERFAVSPLLYLFFEFIYWKHDISDQFHLTLSFADEQIPKI